MRNLDRFSDGKFHSATGRPIGAAPEPADYSAASVIGDLGRVIIGWLLVVIAILFAVQWLGVN